MVSMFFVSCSDAKRVAASRLVMLKNDKIEVGILPRVGGRIVMLKRPGERNVFLSDPALWEEREDQTPTQDSYLEFKAYNGHIVWLGPQSDWWKQQKVTTRHWTLWPPDPYLIYGDFKIKKRTKSYVKMVGPKSVISGVRLVKEITLLSNGKVKFRVTAENIRKEKVSWDLWSVTRVSGHAPSYVPVGKNTFRIDFKTEKPGDVCETPHEVLDGWFTFKANQGVPVGKKESVGKLFTHLDRGVIAVFTDGGCFLKEFDLVPCQKIHPNQALCEVFNLLKPEEKDSLLELEMHGEYRTLDPGASMSLEEVWTVLPYKGEETPKAHIEFLELSLGRERKKSLPSNGN